LALVSELVPPGGEIHPHFAVADLHGEDARLIGELVEGPAGFKVEAGVVPVAGQDAILYGPPVQREPHVGTAVIHSVHLAVVEKERERTTSEANRDAPGGAHLVQPTDSHEVV
jgi:hypothetical protein